jgi:hypothetical protein
MSSSCKHNHVDDEVDTIDVDDVEIPTTSNTDVGAGAAANATFSLLCTEELELDLPSNYKPPPHRHSTTTASIFDDITDDSMEHDSTGKAKAKSIADEITDANDDDDDDTKSHSQQLCTAKPPIRSTLTSADGSAYSLIFFKSKDADKAKTDSPESPPATDIVVEGNDAVDKPSSPLKRENSIEIV